MSINTVQTFIQTKYIYKLNSTTYMWYTLLERCCGKCRWSALNSISDCHWPDCKTTHPPRTCLPQRLDGIHYSSIHVGPLCLFFCFRWARAFRFRSRVTKKHAFFSAQRANWIFADLRKKSEKTSSFQEIKKSFFELCFFWLVFFVALINFIKKKIISDLKQMNKT